MEKTPDPFGLAERSTYLVLGTTNALEEDRLTALVAEALNPLRDPRTACSALLALQRAVRSRRGTRVASVAPALLYPLLLTGPGRADLLLVDEQNIAWYVFEVKIGAEGNRRADGEDQIDAYLRDPYYGAPIRGVSPNCQYVLLNASGYKSARELFPYAETADLWHVASFAEFAEGLQQGSAEEGAFLAGVRAELWAAIESVQGGCPQLQVDEELLKEQGKMGRPQESQRARARGRVLSARLHQLDEQKRKGREEGLDLGPQWEHTYTRGWVGHRFKHESGTYFDIGVPCPETESPLKDYGVYPSTSPGALGRALLDDPSEDPHRRERLVEELVALQEVGAVQYPPWERTLQSGREAVLFLAYDPLEGTGPLPESYQRGLEGAARRIAEAVERATSPEPA